MNAKQNMQVAKCNSAWKSSHQIFRIKEIYVASLTKDTFWEACVKNKEATSACVRVWWQITQNKFQTLHKTHQESSTKLQHAFKYY